MDYFIPLTQGKVAVIDFADALLVSGHDWTASETAPGHWYAQTYLGRENGKDKHIYLHHLLMRDGGGGGGNVGFVDGDGLNCRRANLALMRDLNRTMNLKPIPRTRVASPYRGVYRSENGRWKAKFSRHYLGVFDDPRDAARAYDRAARRHFGPYAIVNFSESGDERLAS